MKARSITTLRALAAAPALLLASCATIMAGGASNVEITSNPSGAAVSASNGFRGETPCIVSMPNGVRVHVDAQHASYPGELREHDSVPAVSAWVAGNILAGGVIGIVVDLMNPGAKVHKTELHFDFDEVPVDPNAVADEVLASKDQLKQVSEKNKRRTSGGTL